MSEYAGYLVGEYAKCVLTDGSTFAEGKVIAWHPKPAYVIQQADGTQVSWNEDLVRTTRRPTHHDHDITQACEDEREAIAAYLGKRLLALDRLNIANPGHGYDREAFRLSIYIDAIRNGEHNQDQS